jgi:hypothetical protein
MEKKTFKFGNKVVPATKNGLPNCIYLTKAEKAYVKAHVAEKKNITTEDSLKQLANSLNNLK